MSSTDAMRAAWAPPCPTGLVTIPFGRHGARITVQPRLVGAFTALADLMAQEGYAIRQGVTGAYNCRQITGGTGYSLHAYGIAVDVNWDRNPYGPTLITDMPARMVANIEALRTRTGAVLFRWGGRYSGNKDAMHYETMASPVQVQSGVVGIDREPTPAQRHRIIELARRQARSGRYRRLEVGMTRPRGRDVAELQTVLHRPRRLPYGHGTAKAVRDFQTFFGLEPTGVVDRGTWEAVLIVYISRALGF